LSATGDIIALSPPLIIEKKEIDHLFDILSGVLKAAIEKRYANHPERHRRPQGHVRIAAHRSEL
jgi:hypothetical protein